MKPTLMILALLVSSAAFAKDAAKEKVCSEKLALTAYNQPVATQIGATVAILDAGYQLRLTTEQTQKLKTIFTNIVKQDASKLEALGKNAYFVCTTDLDADDREIGRRQIGSLLSK